MPRKSAAALSIVPPVGVSEVRRAAPPEDLTDEQKQEWLAVVNRMPADWFPRETHAMLAQFCRHVISARRVANLLDRMEKAPEAFDIREYEAMLRMQAREGSAMSSLATRMRMTQQSTYDESKKKPVQGETLRPWKLAGLPKHPLAGDVPSDS